MKAIITTLNVESQDVAMSLDEALTAAGAETSAARVRGEWIVEARYSPLVASYVGRAIEDFPGGWA